MPAGTVTFLLADLNRAAATDLDRLADLVDSVIGRHGGFLATAAADHDDNRRDRGDGVAAVFPSATDAATAALELAGDDLAPRLRIALHTGEARLLNQRGYTGSTFQRCERLRDIAHGGQTLLTALTASIVTEAPPAGAVLRDRGTHRLRDLSQPERVFELRSADQADDSEPLRSLDTFGNNLPIQLTSFVGRRDELAAVSRLLTSERLVTLTGSGGCGKTRLAAHAAAEQAEWWPDGVWWVEFGPVTDPTLVPELVAMATGALVEPVSGPVLALTRQLRDRRLLICLDNCEHLLDAAAEVVEALLRSCPKISVLVTSREPLGVAGEMVWRVPSLAEDEAVSLFVERASRVRPWFTFDATNEAAVRTMCRRLDGIPLALELAAAWLRTLTPGQIAAGLDDRFALLVRGPRGVVARQQTLAASIEWSHDLLDDTDRIVYRRLAAFSGGFTLDAARAVCADGDVAHDDVLVALGRLVDKSLVVMDERDGVARYRLLETIRQYAADRLHEAGEATTVRDRHLDHFLAFAEFAEVELELDQDTWRARLETEHENLRAAIACGLAGTDPERGRRLAAALPFFWNLHGHTHEGIEFLQRAIALAPGDRSLLQARLLAGLSMVADTGGPIRLELDAAKQGLEIATELGDDRIRGRCLLLAAVAQFYMDFEAAWRLCEQARECAGRADDPFVADGAFALQGMLLSSRDRHEEARPFLDEGVERCRRRGDRNFWATSICYQIDSAFCTGDVRLARDLAEECVRVAEPLGDYYMVGAARCHLGFTTAASGDVSQGRRVVASVVRSAEDAPFTVFVPRMATVLGKLCLWSGELDAAVQWFERDALSVDPAPVSLRSARPMPGLASALRRLGRLDEAQEVADRAISVAAELDVPRLLAEALAESAFLAAAGNDFGRAENLHHEALTVRTEYGLRTFYVDSLDALAVLAYRAESYAEALRLFAASDAGRTAMGYPRPPIDQPEYEATLAATRGALGASEAAAAWTEGAAVTLDEAVAYARRSRGRRARPSTGWASLTPTELDVVRLIVEGLSNPEIASRLLMSRGTVKTHLSHVFTKLALANRTELATLASTQLSKGAD